MLFVESDSSSAISWVVWWRGDFRDFISILMRLKGLIYIPSSIHISLFFVHCSGNGMANVMPKQKVDRGVTLHARIR